MRRSTVCSVVFTAVFSIAAVGQGQTFALLDLALEPAGTTVAPSLAEAALRNDFRTFDSLFRSNADSESYAELYRFWNWSMSDPIGGFYSLGEHNRLARLYPDYARFIADSRIVDDKGNTFYPSAETRRFLLQQALRGIVPKPVSSVTQAATAPPAPEAAPATAAVRPRALQHQPPVQPSIATAAALPKPLAATRSEGKAFVRGIFLIMAGLLAVGMLTVMLQTPPEAPRDETFEEPAASVEPIRFKAAG